jgi:hypothetical protein
MKNLKTSCDTEEKSQQSMLEMMAIVDDQMATQSASIAVLTDRLVNELNESIRA